MCKSLESHIKETITLDYKLHKERDLLLRNINIRDFYVTVLVNKKSYVLNKANLAKYFRYCCREHLAPYFEVHFLSTLTREPSTLSEI